MTEPNPHTEKLALGNGQRQTTQREQILETLEDASGPLTAQQLADLARQEVPDVGVSTVYRTLKMLQEANLVRHVILPDGVARYEKTGRGPHHFHCRGCGRIWSLPFGAVKSLRGSRLADGFLIEDHETILYGRCSNCDSSPSTGATKTG